MCRRSLGPRWRCQKPFVILISIMPKLNDAQLKQLAGSTANIGIVFFATVIGPVFTAVDKVNPFMLLLGLGLTAGSIVISLFILKGTNDKS